MLTPIAIGLLLAALVLFLRRRRQRLRSGLADGILVYSDNTSESCPVLISWRYGLKGKPDSLVRTPDGSLIPVERKTRRAPRQPFDGDLMQAATYCLLVEENYGQTPPVMRIQYADREFDVPFTPWHREWVLQMSERLRTARGTDVCNRSHRVPAKCHSCGQRQNCDQAL
jgi:CRISPR-associated exonuclease Cas4